MCHLTVVGQSKDEARASVLKKLKAKGIENLLALGGDPPQGMTDWRPHPDGFHHAIGAGAGSGEARRFFRRGGWFSGGPSARREPGIPI